MLKKNIFHSFQEIINNEHIILLLQWPYAYMYIMNWHKSMCCFVCTGVHSWESFLLIFLSQVVVDPWLWQFPGYGSGSVDTHADHRWDTQSSEAWSYSIALKGDFLKSQNSIFVYTQDYVRHLIIYNKFLLT